MAEDDLATARSLLASGNRAEAFNHLVRASSAAGGDLARLDAIATEMENAGQNRSALEIRKSIVLADPDDTAAQVSLLRTRVIVADGDISQLRTAETELDAALARGGEHPAMLWLKSAELYRIIGVPGKQARAIKCAMAAEPGSIEVMRQVAHVYFGAGRHWRAWWMLRRLYGRADLPPALMAELSHISREAGCPNLAIRFARRLQALDRANLDALVLEAKALRAKNNTRQAAALIKARLTEFYALQDHGHLALQAAPVLSAGGELAAERTLLQHAAATWPDNQDAAMALQVSQFGVWGGQSPS